jgi:hypothetical protein
MNENKSEKLFADYIRQIEAEDRLIGIRVQWTLTFQGFLFASSVCPPSKEVAGSQQSS